MKTETNTTYYCENCNDELNNENEEMTCIKCGIKFCNNCYYNYDFEHKIIIDDYMLSQQQGTLDVWHRMYGDIKYYIQHFYLYSKGELAESVDHVMNKYGFYMDDETRT